MGKARLLIVEDDSDISNMLRIYFTGHNYEVDTALRGADALEKTRQNLPHLIVLDIMLPDIDGFEVCQILRTHTRTSHVPIIFLTQKDERSDKLQGLELGADDYITKPFSIRELMARVKAHLRRTELIREDMASEVDSGAVIAPKKSLVLQFGNLTIDENRREVLLDGQTVRLKPKEFELLVFLARHKGIALSRDLMLERVWGWTFDGNSRTVDVHVRWLREKIEPDPNQPQRIVTVRGIGYRFDG